MISLPNALSFLRIPLAFLFLSQDTFLRALALAIAALTDFLDGYLARRYNICSKAGTILDPLADKFFVVFALAAFYHEGAIALPELISMFSRDIALCIFGLYLIINSLWKNYPFRSIWCGKISTALQLIVLSALTFKLSVPSSIYALFILLGAFTLRDYVKTCLKLG